jgi:hypothetical protein
VSEEEKEKKKKLLIRSTITNMLDIEAGAGAPNYAPMSDPNAGP